MEMPPATRIRYFTSYSGLKLPLRLIGEIDALSIAHRLTYFRAEYDSDDRIRQLEKWVTGRVELRHRYTYDAAGALLESEVTDADGEIAVIHPTP